MATTPRADRFRAAAVAVLRPAEGLRTHVTVALAGAVVGLVGGGFRWCLEHADRWRVLLLDTAAAHGPAARWAVPVLLTAVGAALACALARLAPYAAGSGVQHVEAVWRQQGETRALRLLPVKFVGGLIALGSGLVLGREGPTVHMGAAVGAIAGRRAGLGPEDARMAHTSLAGAGLAVAFTAPLSGLLFVCEEVTRTVRPRLVLLALIGTATAVTCARPLVGDDAVFPIPDPEVPAMWLLPLFVLFGAATGALGAAYSALVVATLAFCDRFTRVPLVARAAVIGAVVGLLMSADRSLAGGGESLSARLLTGWTPTATVLLLYLAVRFLAGPLSYAAATPGGLFAPLLALGALWGVLAHVLLAPLLPAGAGGADAAAFAVLGMGALFAGVVRAPITGIVLIAEMTGATALLVPLVAASYAATVTADRLESEPIYDTLRRRMLERP
ncbi:ClC family H(+)/Cl(-) exchange transporter (plasmid) [Streptomyces sp. BI20]|uniref:ClC family H(+)/Cl(-) exchange transporter n=1 Tax=Streptomyces sp. BI20 TaxID=3403460 RepID=UPI003C744F39